MEPHINESSRNLAIPVDAGSHPERPHEKDYSFRVMADSCPTMMWVSDAAGAIQFVNKMFRDFAGATIEQVDSGRWQLTLHPDDAPAFVGAFAQAVLARGRFRAEVRVQRSDGEWRWLGSNGESRFSAAGEFLGHIGVCADITRRRQTEQAVLEARQFAQSTIDTLSSLICVLDEAGRIIAANQAWKNFGRAHGWAGRGEHELAGLPDVQFGMGLNYSSLCPAQEERSGQGSADQYAAGIRQVLSGELQEHSMEYSCLGPDRQRWFIVRFTRFLSNGVPRIVAAHTDISELKQSASALAGSEEKFRQLAENVREVFFVLSATTGETLYVSPAFERVWGRSCEYLYHHPGAWEDAIHPDDREQSRLLTMRQMGGEDVAAEYRIRTVEGKEKWIRSRTFPIRNAGGEVVRIVGVADEITERKGYETELIRAGRRADEANRAKSRFLTNMSHEIRTPLNGMLGMVQLLMKTELDPEQQRYVTVARNSGRDLLTLIDGILDLSKVEAGKMTLAKADFNVREAVDEVLQALRLRAEAKRLAIHAHIAPDVPAVLHGDACRFRQVLAHLGDNALKFTDQGSVTLDAALERHTNSTATVRFRVTDSGIGIRPEHISALFSPFTQADSSNTRKYGGTGLGLAICKQLVSLMGGTMGVESSVQDGSTFWFTAVFDASAGGLEAVTQAASQQRSESKNQGGSRILVVEDNLTNREVALAQLSKLGYQGKAVENGLEAVQAVERERYDLILMDCQMPVMDGFEATAQIRLTHPELPIIAVTASAMAEDRERCLTEGLTDYLVKPVELDLLELTLKKWLATSVTEPKGLPAKDGPLEDLRGSIFDSESLLRRVMGDRELAGKLLKGFIQDIPSQLNILSMRINAADAAGVHAQAHLLKGAAATVSAERLRTAAMAIDEAGRKGQLEGCGELLQRAVKQFDDYKNNLKRDGWI